MLERPDFDASIRPARRISQDKVRTLGDSFAVSERLHLMIILVLGSALPQWLRTS